MPKTLAGKWSVGLGIAFVMLMALSLLVAAAREGDSTDISGNPLVTILNVTLNLAGLLSFLVGLFAIIKHQEWSVVVYLAVLYGLAALMFVLGEFLFPH